MENNPVKRVAQCSCSNLKVTATGDPDAVVACHCVACQRRTGSVLGVSAYWPQNRIHISGQSKAWMRISDSGNEFTTHFCTNCGTSLYWIVGNKPGVIGVGVGGFGDPSFPSPVRSVWEQTMHQWVSIGVARDHFLRGRTSINVS